MNGNLKSKIMKIKIATFCLLFVSILFSCKKEDVTHSMGNATATATYIPALSKVLIDNQSANEFLYNDTNMVWQEKTRLILTIHHYNAKGQLVTSEYYGNDDALSSDQSVSQTAMTQAAWVTLASGKKIGIITYEYNDNGQLTKSTTTHPLITCTEYSLYTYDSNNRINRQSMFRDEAATGYIDYTYDIKGNLASETLYTTPSTGDPVAINSTKYSFDGAPNPYRMNNKIQIPGINTNINNIVKETNTIYLPAALGSDNVTVADNVYTYNTLGYPVSKNGNMTYVYE
jgi:hypothetical protein